MEGEKNTSSDKTGTTSDLDQELKKFFDDYLIKKTLFFKEEDAKEYPFLMQHGLIKVGRLSVAGRNHAFEITQPFVEMTFDHFSKVLKFSIDDQIESTLSFVEQVRTELAGDNSQGILVLLQILISNIISKQESEFGEKFNAYMSILTRDNKHFWPMLSVFIEKVRQKRHSVTSLSAALLNIADQIATKAHYDGKWFEVKQAILDYISRYPEDGVALYDLFVTNERVELENLYSACLEGMLNADVISKEGIAHKLTVLAERDYAALALSNTLDADGKFCQKIVDILRGTDYLARPFSLQVPKLLTAIDSVIKGNDLIKRQVAEMITEFLGSGDQEIVNNCWRIMCSQTETTPNMELRITRFIISDSSNDDHLQSLGNAMIFSEDVGMLFRFMRATASKQRLAFNYEIFSSAAIGLRGNNESIFDKFFIELLIDDEGINRFAGAQLLQGIKHHLPAHELAYDVASMKAVKQYQFCIASRYVFMQPEEMLPLILPLRFSTSPVILELLTVRLEELYSDFGEIVFTKLVEAFGDPSPDEAAILQRIEKLKLIQSEKIKKRFDCKELSSQHTLAKLMREYHKHYQVQLSQLKEDAHNRSIAGIFGKNFILARGGGWKPDGKSNVQQLSSFEVSMRMPTSLMKNPERYNSELTEFYTYNWKSEYDPWEQIL